MAKFVDIDMDVQILICTFLHPSDILALRKTCKTFQPATRQRTIWIDALYQVCLENTLFLPSFPILDMNDVELEQAAMAPRRWIELCTPSTARGRRNSKVILSPTATRIIDDPFAGRWITSLILVPGGRYLVGFSPSGLGVWDLGYTSSANCKLIAYVGPDGGSVFGEVHATPDGMGLVICSLRPSDHCSVYEIYPQSEYPQLTKLACLDLPSWYFLPSIISPDKVIWYHPDLEENGGIIFRVWDYRLNTSVSFKGLIDMEKMEDNPTHVATQTAIILLHAAEIFIWTIPPLLPQPLNFDDFTLTPFPPAIRIKFPDGLGLDPSFTWIPMSSWYFDPSKPLYFDKVYSKHAGLERFKIIIKPDFSGATLNVINTIRPTTSGLIQETNSNQSMVCEDTLVLRWGLSGQCGVYTGSTLSRYNFHEESSLTRVSLDVGRSSGHCICPASGRYIYVNSRRNIYELRVSDFLPHQRLR